MRRSFARTLARGVVAGATWMTLGACGRVEGAPERVAVRDSAGVRIVENRGAPGELGWRVDEAPLLDLGGGADGGLYQVADVARLEDGRIVVAGGGANQVRVYAPDGRLLRTLGREGEGPGEFQALSWVGRLPGDSVAAWDAMQARLSVFTPAGDFARAVTPRASLGAFPQAVGVLGDGRVVVAAGGAAIVPALGGKPRRDTLAYVVLGRDGAVADTLGRFPGTEMIAVGSPAGGLLMGPLPFGRRTVAAVHGGRVFVGTGDRYELAAYEPGRGLRARIRAERAPVPVTREDIADYRRTLVTLGAEGDAQLRRQQELLLKEAPYPATMPPFTGLEADDEGNLWVEEPRRPGDERGSVWTVISPEGRVRGTVRLPRGLQLREIGRDWVLGVALDDDDVEHVRLHRLVRR